MKNTYLLQNILNLRNSIRITIRNYSLKVIIVLGKPSKRIDGKSPSRSFEQQQKSLSSSSRKFSSKLELKHIKKFLIGPVFPLWFQKVLKKLREQNEQN